MEKAHWRWAQEGIATSPPVPSRLSPRALNISPAKTTNTHSGIKRYPTTRLVFTTSERESVTSPSSLSFLSSALFNANGTSGAALTFDPQLLQEERWDVQYTLRNVPLGCRSEDVQLFLDSLAPLDEDVEELKRQAMSSGNSNASSDSTSSSTSSAVSSSGQSPWSDFSSPIWDSFDAKTSAADFAEFAPYAEDLERFMASFYNELRASRPSEKWSPNVSHFGHISRTTERFAASRADQLTRLSLKMNTKRLTIACAEFDLPTEAILLLNAACQLSSNHSDPVDSLVGHLKPIEAKSFTTYLNNAQHYAELNRLKWFLEKGDTNRELLCFFVWSLPDASLVSLTCSKLHPYPFCKNCCAKFGTRVCAQCQVARYCSRECQVANWETSHGDHCAHVKDSLSTCTQMLHLDANMTNSNTETSSTPSPSP